MSSTFIRRSSRSLAEVEVVSRPPPLRCRDLLVWVTWWVPMSQEIFTRKVSSARPPKMIFAADDSKIVVAASGPHLPTSWDIDCAKIQVWRPPPPLVRFGSLDRGLLLGPRLHGHHPLRAHDFTDCSQPDKRAVTAELVDEPARAVAPLVRGCTQP